MNQENEMLTKGKEDPLEDKKKDKKKKWVVRIVILIIVIILILLGLNKCGYCGREQNTDYQIGAGVKQGELDKDDGSHESGKANGTSSMRVKINGFPVFPDGKSAGSLRIENPAENSLYMKVEIKLNNTSEVIYESGAIPPNHYIDEDKLTKILEKGEYNATAYVTLFNPENEDVKYNSANFDLIIKIEN